ncbi:hypothetical protein C8F04DRAFT_1149751 [Mycena alexandri]|uniref:Uncharacterized protein n=1 Tax=Mycena alexandri TaxID=1745969 RepID=A0AAD6S0C2_9AGAR|nr:hypothetical protein C8F04DRAFT_1149751 [Mycena alexandri]
MAHRWNLDTLKIRRNFGAGTNEDDTDVGRIPTQHHRAGSQRVSGALLSSRPGTARWRLDARSLFHWGTAGSAQVFWCFGAEVRLSSGAAAARLLSVLDIACRPITHGPFFLFSLFSLSAETRGTPHGLLPVHSTQSPPLDPRALRHACMRGAKADASAERLRASLSSARCASAVDARPPCCPWAPCDRVVVDPVSVSVARGMPARPSVRAASTRWCGAIRDAAAISAPHTQATSTSTSTSTIHIHVPPRGLAAPWQPPTRNPPRARCLRRPALLPHPTRASTARARGRMCVCVCRRWREQTRTVFASEA